MSKHTYNSIHRDYYDTYIRFLSLFLFLRVADKFTLSLLGDWGFRIHYYFKCALSDGYLSCTAYCQDSGVPGAQKRLIYTLTKKGLKFLAEVKVSQLPIAERLKFLTYMNYEILEPHEKTRSGRVKLAMRNMAAVYAYRAGASLPSDTFIRYKEGPSGGDTVCLPYYLNSRDFKFFGEDSVFGSFNERSVLRFTPADSAVSALAARNEDKANQNKYKSPKFIGILDSWKTPLFLYTYPTVGKRWGKIMAQNEADMYSEWVAMHDYDTDNTCSESSGAMLVDSAAEFYKLYSCSNSGSPSCRFGGNFSHFYVLPKDENGVHLLTYIMLSHEYGVEYNLMTEFLGKDYMIRRLYEDLFPAVTKDGIQLSPCMFSDIVKLEKIIRTANLSHGASFGIVCFPWQAPYYEKLLPDNVKLITICDYSD